MLAKTDQVDARTLRDFADVLARHKDRGKYITRCPMSAGQLAELMARGRHLATGACSHRSPLSSSTATTLR